MKAKIKTLKNGLRIVTVEMPDAPTVTVMVMVAAGTRYETRATNGLSHFLEHMCFKGTTKRTVREIAYELESMGAVTNAFTGHDFTAYYAKGRANLFPKLLDVVADVYLNSTFPQAELDKERGVICGEIDVYEDFPMQKVQMIFAESLYGDQPAGYSILGPKENIKSFTREDFLKYHDTHYRAGKTTIVVAGNIDHVQVVDQVKKQFAKIANGGTVSKKKIVKKSGERILIHNKKHDQAHIVAGVRSIPLGHPDHAALEVAMGVLGTGMSSRLFIRLREEMGAGYYVSAGNASSDDAGEITISTGTEPKRVHEIITAIFDELEKMRKGKVSEDELAKVKESMVGRVFMSMEATDEVASYIAQQATLRRPLQLPRDLEREIRRVSTADVLRVAKKYLKPEKFHLAIIGLGGDVQTIGKILG